MESGYLPRHYTERMARLLTDHMGLTPPVNVYSICDHFRVEVWSEHFEREFSGLFLRLPPNRKVLCYNRWHPMPRQRFTIMHELAHYILQHHLNKPSPLLFGHLPGVSPNPQEEREANQLAAAVLMPEVLVHDWYEELQHNSQWRLRIMADRFGVSVAALKFRLSELGIIPKENENGG